ncbi:MAG: hypothetical protein GX270_03330 [Clostridiaceae bacterium]|jgi:hypothetical protein|nr:hypothetical protein [Clostridiaceae bacterium]
MKKSRNLLLLLIICLVLVVSSAHVLAEERSIYVGDLIELKIQSRDLTLDELQDKFKDFEIVKISNISEGYILTLRSFETGEKTIHLGDKEVNIIVKSTLDEIERTDVYDGDPNPLGTGFYLKWKYVFFPLVAIFLLTLILNIRSLLRKKKASSLTPYERFIKAIGNLSVNEEDYLVKLTLCFKDYIGSTYSFPIKGKTSTEIVYEIRRLPGLNEYLSKIKSWLNENDYFKFSGTTAPIAKKLELMERLTELVKSIEASKEGEIQ